MTAPACRLSPIAALPDSNVPPKRRDEQSPRRRGGELDVVAVLLDQLASGVEVVRSLQRQRFDVGQCAPDQTHQRARRRQLDDRGNAEVAERLHAAVPAHWRGYLVDEAADELGPVGDDAAVGVRQQAGAGLGRRETSGELMQAGDGRRHVAGVECAGHGQRAQPRTFGRVGGQCGELLGGAGRDHLAGRVDVGGGQAELGQLREYRISVTTQDGGHAGRVDRCGAGHGAAALAHEHQRRFRRKHAGQRGGGDLADTVAGDGSDVARDVVEAARQPARGLAGNAELWLPVREKYGRGGEAGTDEKRLGDRGVSDLVGVGGGAQAGKVEIENRRPPGHRVGDAGEFEPGRQKSGNLGTLTGGEQREHEIHLAVFGRAVRCPVGPSRLRDLVENLQRRPVVRFVSQSAPPAGRSAASRPSTRAICRVNAPRASVAA